MRQLDNTCSQPFRCTVTIFRGAQKIKYISKDLPLKTIKHISKDLSLSKDFIKWTLSARVVLPDTPLKFLWRFVNHDFDSEDALSHWKLSLRC